jgi:hypothetical protein
MMRRYPHLSPGDTQIWQKFLEDQPDYFEAVTYDVHVGEGQVPTHETDPAMIKMAIDITTRRIDVLAERRGQLYIVEIKYDPGVSVVGQLTGYRALMAQKDPATKSAKLLAIVNRTDPDLITIFDSLQIQHITVNLQ